MNNIDLVYVLKLLPGIILGLTVHEFMHAKVACWLGDTTARDQGRVTLNPIKHIDLWGFVFIIFAGFGWAKPVQINREALKNPRRGEMLIAVAGPLSNLVMGILCAAIIKLIVTFFPVTENQIYSVIVSLLLYAVFINYGLFIFNILPVPPLDGSHLIFNALKIREETERKIFKYGIVVLFAIIIIENQTNLHILPLGKVITFMAENSFRWMGIHFDM